MTVYIIVLVYVLDNFDQYRILIVQERFHSMIVIDSKRTVALLGKINTETAGRVIRDIMERYEADPQKEVTLFISSGGGSVDAGFMLVDVLRTLVKTGCKLVTIGSGLVGSMAIPVFMCGKNRKITTHTRFFFHELGFISGSETRMSTSGAAAQAKSLGMIQKWYADFVEQHSGGKMIAETVEKLMEEESFLYPQDILEKGIAHEII